MRVSVVDINDNRPTFYPVLYTVSLSTHSAPGTSVVKVTANDPDAGENGRVTYRTVPGGGSAYFTLNKDTGMYCYRVLNHVLLLYQYKVIHTYILVNMFELFLGFIA